MAGRRKSATAGAGTSLDAVAAAVTEADVPIETPVVEASATVYATKVIVPEPAPIRNRVLNLDGTPVVKPAEHVHHWERGRTAAGIQVYRCECGAERPR